MNSRIRILLTVLAVLLAFSVGAQRRVTPVPSEPLRTTQPTPEQQRQEALGRVAHRHDANGNIVLVDTVTGLEYVDSSAINITKMIYPKIFRISAGVNLWDLAMRCFGQDYGIGSVWAQLNMHNRYFPYFEGGVGTASITPDASNFTYHSPLAPYFKIGCKYNVFYNSNPAYQFLVGLNYGFTPFSYNVDATINDNYWGETTQLAIPKQNMFAGYWELCLGVKVKIVGNFSLGWNMIYHSMLHESKAPMGKPIYIPGYGKRDTHFTGMFSAIYTFELNHPATPVVNTEKE